MASFRVAPTSSREWRSLAVVGALVCVLLVGCAPERAASVPRSSSSPQTEWRNASYRLTCDGLVSGEVRARLVNGAARLTRHAAQATHYDPLDIRLEGSATGDVDGDGKPDSVVLLQCSPQPSNGSVEEVHVFRADGSELGVLPSPGTLPEMTILAPLYVPSGLSIQHEEIVASMK